MVVNGVQAGWFIRMDPDHGFSNEQFHEFCRANPDLRIEKTADGEIEIMPPTVFETGYRNAGISSQLDVWAERDGRGYGADSSTGYRLANRATRSPDASWILRSRFHSLSVQERRKKFLPLCPDFVIELRSGSDRLVRLQSKMSEWIENGAQLGWLIDPIKSNVQIYRPSTPPETIAAPPKLHGEGPVAGFHLDLKRVWTKL